MMSPVARCASLYWLQRLTIASFVTLLLILELQGCARPVSAAQPLIENRSNDWITMNKDYSSQRYVALDQITPHNVGKLKEVCELQLNEPTWFNSGLLMVGRTLYVAALRATWAIDAATCQLRWRSILKLGPTANISTRGPGYSDGRIFRGTADGRVIAFDALTGKVLWDVAAADPAKNESFVAAPIAWHGKVFTGISISDLGIHGRLIALDAKTGRELWRFHTVPEPNDPAAKTWDHGKPAGGGFWTSFSLDPATGEVFGPVANPAPDFHLAERPGENLYTNSVIAVDAATGRLHWYYQITTPDDHDWDLGSAPTLYRARNGKEMIAIAGKDGYVIGLDRTSKTPVFKRPATQILNNGRLPLKQTLVCPGLGGGSQYNGAAYNPDLGALYIGEVNWCAYFKQPEPMPKEQELPTKREQSALNYGYHGAVEPAYDRQPRGRITAMDGATGRVLWRYETDGQTQAGLVPTKSGLLFAGDVRGNLLAFDARNGAVLRHIDVGGAINNGLISYAVDRTQYVAVASGGLSLNVAGVAGPLKVSIFSLQGSDTPQVLKLERADLGVSGDAANATMYATVCAACHGADGKGRTFPSLVRFTQLGDPDQLKAFLTNVPPPMPALYPGMLTDDDVAMIAAYLKKSVVDEHAGPPSGYVQPTSDGSRDWQAVYSVFTSARCMNCHTAGDFPRQSDQRYPHVFHVVRGADDNGVAPLRCSACHTTTNNVSTGIPGSLSWHMAPVAQTFESAPGIPFDGSALCSKLKDPSKTGGRNLAALLDHIDHDTDVTWGFNPGDRPRGGARTKPPLSHEDFVGAFKRWIADGAPCPGH